MSFVSQTIRSGSTSAANPSGLMGDILALNNSFSGAGAPVSVPGAIVGNSYIDTVSGIEYKLKGDNTWEPYVDFTSFAPPPADPLTLDQLNVNTIRGNASDSVLIDLGATGDLNVTLAPGQVVDVGGGSATIQGNGNITTQSTMRAYDALIDSFAGRQLSVQNTPEYRIKVQGTPDLMVIESALDNDIELRTDGVGKVSVKKVGAGQIDIDPQNSKISSNSSPFTVAAGILKLDSFGGGLQLNSSGITTCTDLLTGKAIVMDPSLSTIANNANGTFSIQQTTSGEDVELKAEATGAGNVVLRPGATGQVQCIENLSLQGKKLQDTVAINGGDVINRYGILSVNAAGTLGYSYPSHSHSFTWSNVGGDGVSYGVIGGLSPINPGDFGAFYNPFAARVNMMSVVLIFNAPWSFNSGTAVLELVRVPTNQTVTTGNASVVAILNIPTGANFYQYSLGSNTDISAPSGKYGMRLTVTGATSTSTTAEMVATVFFN